MEKLRRKKIFDIKEFVMPTEQKDYQKPDFKMFYNMAMTFEPGSDKTSLQVNPVGYLEASAYADASHFDEEMFLEGKKENEFDETLWGSQYNRHV